MKKLEQVTGVIFVIALGLWITETIINFEITGPKIDATYRAVVEFIKFYNQNK